jgi:hypothetical protein
MEKPKGQRRMKRSVGFVVGLMAAATLAACTASQSQQDVGMAQIAIVAAPSGVQCIVVTVMTSTSTIQRSISVTAGGSTNEMITGLPLGSDVFLGAAYSVACSSITANTAATYLSAPVTATVVAGTPVSVTLKMQTPGAANVAVDFPCPAGKADCDGNISNGCEVTLATDKNNCGACGNVCSLAHATSTCTGGACAVSACSTGFANCDGNAANGCEAATTTDPKNCGGCGKVCALANTNPVCSAGACVATSCTAGFANCDGNTANGCETAITTDANNCGACGHVCSGANGTEKCSGGVCTVATCNAGFADCDGNAANGCETAVGTDKNNCGTCGYVCSSTNGTASCSGSKCSISCNAGFGNCDGNVATGCETPLNTPANCGSCATACNVANGSAACTAGACAVASCNAGFANCNGIASDGCETAVAGDPNNCGSCGYVCSQANDTPACSGGVCSFACNPGFANCNGIASDGCETPTTTVTNCGSCGDVCGSANGTPGCMSGSCTIGCNAGFGNCDGNTTNGCETNVNTDPNHCGSCGTICNIPNGTPACSGGVCQVGSCNAGFANCDGNAANGCETTTGSNPTNCGACGVVCSTTNASSACVAGACQLTCNVGFADCNNNPVDGCETNLNTDPNHCGSCGTVCSGTQSCVGGLCQ